MAHSAGGTIGPYRIIEAIGRGGMASVFKAYEPSLDRYVALKILPPEFLHDPTFAARFRREAQTIARLEHPRIIPIFAYDIDAPSGTPWMAMRLISGGSLSQRIARGRLAPLECARILNDVAEALDYAHTAGVIHRDVKPHNVLLDDAGRVYLADFGIARMVEASSHMTQTGMITGTPQYMAPEQALGKAIDKGIDIYALGIVAYELFTGRVPFSADTPVAVLMKQTTEPMPLPPVSEVREEVTRAILRATAKDPSARWPSAGAFASAIHSATTLVGSVAATVAMPALGEETIRAVTERERSARPPGPGSKPAPAAEEAGRTLGLMVAALVVIASMATGVAYLRYQSYLATTAASVAPATAAVTPAPLDVEQAGSQEPEAAPEGEDPPVYVPAGTPVAETTAPEVSTETVAPPSAPPPRQETPSAGTDLGGEREPLSPAERRALLGRGPLTPQQRMEAMAAARRERGLPVPGDRTPLVDERSAGFRKPALTRVNLNVETSQSATGPQVRGLFGEIVIDNRTYRRFMIRFGGLTPFARERQVQNIVLEGVPVTAREISVAIATDANLTMERVEGSTRLTLEGDETNLSVAIRFDKARDRSVVFR